MNKNKLRYETAKFFHPIVTGVIVGILMIIIGQYTGNWGLALIPFMSAAIGIITGSRGHMDKWK